MTWIGLVQGSQATFSPTGLNASGLPRGLATGPEAMAVDAPMTEGTLLIETIYPGSQDVTLYDGGPGGWRIRVLAGGVADVRLPDGAGLTKPIETGFATPTSGAPLRLWLTWSAQARALCLTVDVPGTTVLAQTEFTASPLIRRATLAAMFGPEGRPCWARTGFAALADRRVPVGGGPAVLRGTPVATPTGQRNVETLRAGDRVLTRDHGAQTLRYALRRDVPAFGTFTPMRLRAPHLGLSRDILVGADQRLLITDPAIAALYGRDTLLVPAGALDGLEAAYRVRPCAFVRQYYLIFDAHEVVWLGGCPAESVYLGHLRDTPDLAATTILGAVPHGHLPRHDITANAVLPQRQIRVLRAALAA